LDSPDFFHSPVKGRLKASINICKVINKAWAVAVAGEKTREFLIVHAAENGPFAYFESIEMQYRKYRARLSWVDVLVCMPSPIPT
jgi:hypothetical protein